MAKQNSGENEVETWINLEGRNKKEQEEKKEEEKKERRKNREKKQRQERKKEKEKKTLYNIIMQTRERNNHKNQYNEQVLCINTATLQH